MTKTKTMMQTEITELLTRMRKRIKKSAGFSTSKLLRSLPHMSKKGKEMMTHNGRSGPYRKEVKCDTQNLPSLSRI